MTDKPYNRNSNHYSAAGHRWIRTFAFDMNFALQIAFVAAAVAGLAGCSCGIFRNEYVPATARARMSDRLVTRVAAASGFSPKSPADAQTRFAKKDVELIFEERGQVLVLRSSYCPLVPFRVDPEPWESRCKEDAEMIEKCFRIAGVPLRKLSTDESIARDRKGERVGGKRE